MEGHTTRQMGYSHRRTCRLWWKSRGCPSQRSKGRTRNNRFWARVHLQIRIRRCTWKGTCLCTQNHIWWWGKAKRIWTCRRSFLVYWRDQGEYRQRRVHPKFRGRVCQQDFAFTLNLIINAKTRSHREKKNPTPSIIHEILKVWEILLKIIPYLSSYICIWGLKLDSFIFSYSSNEHPKA